MFRRWMDYTRQMGPAWIVSAVACGPATLASVVMAGASYGYGMLWVVVLSAVFGTTAQYLAARVGILEGRGIIAATQDRLGRGWAWLLALDAVLATYLAAIVLMNALVGVTSLITGIHTPWWGLAYAVLLSASLLHGGYRWFENLCKVLVLLVVACFMVTAGQAHISWGQVLAGLMPSLPGGVQPALMAAAIMGGAVHITIIGMHTYNTNARGWQRAQLPLARFDTVVSMGLAFGAYSLAIFLVGAALLHPAGVVVQGPAQVVPSLRPLLGGAALGVFLAGLWAATFSTIMPTYLAAAYFIFDKMGWPAQRSSARFRLVLVGGVLLSALGPFLKGGFFFLLPVMLALGLCGTPLIIAIILYLLNQGRLYGGRGVSWPLNLLGVLTLVITTLLAARFILSILRLW
ncbi:MAG: divalent metal cation transporter [Thermodesulfobacteriota bacterium]